MTPAPETMAQALRNGLLVGPLKDVEHRTWYCMRDFLAVKFGKAILEAENAGNGNLARKLDMLYKDIVGEAPTGRGAR